MFLGRLFKFIFMAIFNVVMLGIAVSVIAVVFVVVRHLLGFG